MDRFFVIFSCGFAGFMAGNLATMFLTHWLRAVLSAFGKEPFYKPAAPHRIDIGAAVITTLLHPVP
jgi:hypothetical protein